MIRLGLYMLFLYTLVICFGFYINQAHGQEGPRSCADYLRICETSCLHRGDLYRFDCLGATFQPIQERYRCFCGDDAFRVTRSAQLVRDRKSASTTQVTK